MPARQIAGTDKEARMISSEALASAARDVIAEHLYHQAAWRGEKASEYPDDDRNARAAKTLENLGYDAEYIPLDDPSLVALASIAQQHGQDDPYVWLSFTDGDGSEVTSTLHLWNYGDEPTLRETLDRIVEATRTAWEEVAQTA